MSSVDKAINVLATVCEANDPLRFTDIAARSGLPKSTVHRLVNELVRHRLIRLDETDQCYGPGLRLLTFAQRTWDGLDVRQAAREEMRRLIEDVQETIHLAVLDGQEIIYIDKLESPKTIRLFSAVGKRGPVFCTGVGKTLLAFLDPARQDQIIHGIHFVRHTANTIASEAALRQALGEIRVRGCGLDMEEHEEGIRCIAAPIFNFRGEVIASLSITSTAGRLTTERLQDLQPRVLTAARNISRELGRVTSADYRTG